MARKAVTKTISLRQEEWDAITERAKKLKVGRSKLMATLAIYGALNKEARLCLGIEAEAK